MKAWKRLLLPGALTAFASATLLSVGLGNNGQGAGLGAQHGGNRGPLTAPAPQPPLATAPLGGGTLPTVGGATALIGVHPNVGLANSDVLLMVERPFAPLLLPGFLSAELASMTELPGTFFYSFAGGMGDGGNLYHYVNGVFLGPFPSGFPSMPGLAWDETSSTVWGSAQNLSFGDTLVSCSPLGPCTLVGVYGGGIVGVDAIADDPCGSLDGTFGAGPNSVLHGFTGFGYDGSPGDVIAINKFTGAAVDTGIDLRDNTSGALAPGTIGDAAFAADGTGYLGVGSGVGDVLRFSTSTYGFDNLGNAVAGSMSGIEVLFDDPFNPPPVVTQTELAGNSLSRYPFFEYARTFNQGSTIEVAVDTGKFPSLVGQTTDVYITSDLTAATWKSGPLLVDLTGDGPNTFTFPGGIIQNNTVTVDAGTLTGVGPAPWTDVGFPYDVVIDVDQDGRLSTGDFIDGFIDAEAGAYVAHDITQPGPFAVTEILYSGGVFLGQDTYYPSNIAALGRLPLVVVSHGNGHNYQWYDHIGNHMGSYGYIVMSHQNNTGPGIETASTTTLTNTDYIINNQATIGGGVLNGHIDTNNIVWIGHSRGGEGIVRAYDRIFDGTFVPTSGYTLADLKLLSSMAPTDFLGTASSTPHSGNYHLWTGSADSDVNGCASCNLCQTFHLHDRAESVRLATTLQGVGHTWFHDNGGFPFASGPCLLDEAQTHRILLPHLLALIEHYVEGSVGAKDFLWRQYESFAPIGGPTGNPCTVVTHMYREGAGTGKFVIDDFQSNPATNLSSSGGAVAFTVLNLTEGEGDDNDSVFTDLASDPFNGTTLAGTGGVYIPDDTSLIVFDWSAPSTLTFDVVPAAQNVTPFEFLSFRSAQQTRHTFTTSTLGDLTYSVTLIDGATNSSTINIAAYGGGIEEPYQRTGCGAGTGWHNEYEVVRIRLTDFCNNASGIDPTNITQIRFDFGAGSGSTRGRIGLDDIELTID